LVVAARCLGGHVGRRGGCCCSDMRMTYFHRL
jgi:hypothetical protein